MFGNEINLSILITGLSVFIITIIAVVVVNKLRLNSAANRAKMTIENAEKEAKTLYAKRFWKETES